MITFTDGWREEQIHQEIMKNLQTENEMLIFNGLKPKLEIVDDGWNCNLGEWPHYIEGTGATIAQAISDFVQQYYRHNPSKKQIEDAVKQAYPNSF